MTFEEWFEKASLEYAQKHFYPPHYSIETERRAFESGAKFMQKNNFVWHDLRKDPNDLPKECRNVLCFVWQGEGYYCVGHIIKGGDNFVRWWASNKSEQLNVIAWCEIPQFKE